MPHNQAWFHVMFAAIALEEIIRFIVQVSHDFLAVLLGYRDTGLFFRLLSMRLLARPFRIPFRKKVLDLKDNKLRDSEEE